MRRFEYELHHQVAEYLGLVLLQPAWFTTFPAGSGGKARGGKLKACGLKPGVPDILLIYGGRAFWIELKSKMGRVSDEQRKCAAALADAGCSPLPRVARSIEDVNTALDCFHIPYRKVELSPSGARVVAA